MQAGIGSQSPDKSARLQARSDSNLLLHSPHERGQPRQSSGVTSSPHQNPDSKPTELPRAMHQADPSAASGSSEAGQSASHKAEELETKLSELTRRLSVAEQAAGVSSEIQSQLLQLKEDKAALQADLKQFMQHTSSMLTTIQAQMSRLMGCAPPTSAFPSAEHSYASAAVGQSDRRQGQGQLGAGHPETALPLQPQAQGSAEPNSPVGLAQARSSISDWRLESHGNQPSPLARHEIFQNAAPSKQLLPRATHSRAQAGQSGSWMDELCMGQDSRSTKVCWLLLGASGHSHVAAMKTWFWLGVLNVVFCFLLSRLQPAHIKATLCQDCIRVTLLLKHLQNVTSEGRGRSSCTDQQLSVMHM